MMERAKLSNLYTVLSEGTYPITRSASINVYDDVILVLADGEQNLGDLLTNSNTETFASADELTLEVMMLLPRIAVGEPFQSEGEG
jgi:hypothetical protein